MGFSPLLLLLWSFVVSFSHHLDPFLPPALPLRRLGIFVVSPSVGA